MYVFCVLFPIVAIGCGLYVLWESVAFVITIRSAIRGAVTYEN